MSRRVMSRLVREAAQGDEVTHISRPAVGRGRVRWTSNYIIRYDAINTFDIHLAAEFIPPQCL